MRKYLFPILTLVTVSYSSAIIECRIATGNYTQCNPYTKKLLRSEEIRYNKGKKELVGIKSLPVTGKTATINVITVEEMIERHSMVHDPLRFKNSDLEPFEAPPKPTDVIAPEVIVPEKKLVVKEVSDEVKGEIGLYTVVQGNVLSGIAKKFNMTTQSLREFNALPQDAILSIGQKLKIPLSQEIVDAMTTAVYRVKRGDSILSIAQKFKLDPKLLANFNKIRVNASIHIGKELDLPLPHKLEQMAAKTKYSKYGDKILRVTATAYTSHSEQTSGNPFLGAWSNRLVPGSKVIAVSRDLLHLRGIRNGAKVRIAGLSGTYTVRDKMHKRYKKRIDIYMGLDKRSAIRWGRRSVNIYWD